MEKEESIGSREISIKEAKTPEEHYRAKSIALQKALYGKKEKPELYVIDRIIATFEEYFRNSLSENQITNFGIYHDEELVISDAVKAQEESNVEKKREKARKRKTERIEERKKKTVKKRITAFFKSPFKKKEVAAESTNEPKREVENGIHIDDIFPEEKYLAPQTFDMRNMFWKFFRNKENAAILYDESEKYDALEMMKKIRRNRYRKNGRERLRNQRELCEYYSELLSDVQDAELKEAFKGLLEIEDTTHDDGEIPEPVEHKEELIPLDMEIPLDISDDIREFKEELKKRNPEITEQQLKQSSNRLLKFAKSLWKKIKGIVIGNEEEIIKILEGINEDEGIKQEEVIEIKAKKITEEDFSEEAREEVNKIVLDDTKNLEEMIQDVLEKSVMNEGKKGGILSKLANFSLNLDTKLFAAVIGKGTDKMMSKLKFADREKFKGMLMALYEFGRDITVPGELKAGIACMELALQVLALPEILERETDLARRTGEIIKKECENKSFMNDLTQMCQLTEGKAELAVLMSMARESVLTALLRTDGNSLGPIDENTSWDKKSTLPPEQLLHAALWSELLKAEEEEVKTFTFELKHLSSELAEVASYKRAKGKDITERDILFTLDFRKKLWKKILKIGGGVIADKLRFKPFMEGVVAISKLIAVLKSNPVEVDADKLTKKK